MIIDLVQTAITQFDEVEFSSLAKCPYCGGPVQGYDVRKKKFAVIFEKDHERKIMVKVKRFSCWDCHSLCYADEPFYPATRLGSPVVDLCITLATTMPKNRVAKALEVIGVLVDRSSCRNYNLTGPWDIPVAEVFGMRIPFSILALSSLAARTREGSRIKGAEALAACGFPSAHRTPLHNPVTGKERDERNKKEGKEERDMPKPE
jgi:hypothetical protein